MQAAPRRAVSPWLLAVAAYAALTVAFLWPVVTHLSSAFPHDAGDPVLATSILTWNARTLPLTGAWWDAPIFWPVHGALSFSEHLLGISLLTTPLLWAGVPPLTTYNLAFLASFTLSALAAHALAFACVKRHDAAALAGCIFGFSPFRVAELAHLQVLWSFGMPLALTALHRFTPERDRRWLVVFGVACLTQAAASGYYMLFFPVLVAAWALWFARQPARLVPIAVTGIVAALPLVPLLWMYAARHAAMQMVRGINEIQTYSADMTALFVASPELIVWHRLSRPGVAEGQLFPGALALLLVAVPLARTVLAARAADTRGVAAWRPARIAAAAVAAVFLAVAVCQPLVGPWALRVGDITVASASTFDKPLSVAVALSLLLMMTTPTFQSAWRRRSAFAFYVCASAAALFLSFGPRPALGATPVLYEAPYAWLMALPGFSEIRVPARFGMLFVLCVAVAAAIGFARLTAARPLRSRRILAAAAIAIVLIESWPRIPLAAPAVPIAALRGVGGRAPVLELPLGIVERDLAAMYRAIEHRHPIVNGYSGYDPAYYQVLKIGLRLNDGAVLDELARDRELIVAVDHREQFARWAAVVGPRAVIGDDGDWRLYRIPAVSQPPAAIGPPLPVASVAAGLRNEVAGQMLDGDPRTAWSTGRVQTGGESLVIDLGRAQDLSAVRLTQGPFTFDFPRALAVECSADAARWEVCWRGSTAALALRGLLDDPRTGLLTLIVTARAVRYLRLRQIGADPTNGWAIAELTVFGPPAPTSQP